MFTFKRLTSLSTLATTATSLVLFAGLCGVVHAQSDNPTSPTVAANSTSTSATEHRSARVFEVSDDGSREYSSIESALKAASDPNVEKVIRIYPGDYDLGDDKPLNVTVAKTHLVGLAYGAVNIKGRVELGPISSAIIHIKADDCSVQNLYVQNTARDSDRETFKSCALLVEGDNFNARDCTFTGITDDDGYGGFAYDVVWFVNSDDARMENCRVRGSSDIISIDRSKTDFVNCTVDTLYPGGGYPFYVANKCVVDVYNLNATGETYAYFTIQSIASPSLINLRNAASINGKDIVKPYYCGSIPGAKAVLNVVSVYGRYSKKATGITQNIGGLD